MALRLEAWAKNVKQEKQEEDRTERSKNKVRITAKPETTKASQHTESNDRLNKLETQVTQIHQELKKLTATPKVFDNSKSSATTTSDSFLSAIGDPGNCFGRGNIGISTT